MRAVWVDAGNDPDYGKLNTYGITRPYFDPRDPRVNAKYLDGVKAHAGIDGCGIYVAWNWTLPLLTPAALAALADTYLKTIHWLGNPAVCFDIEKGDGLDNFTWWPYLMDTMRAWRAIRPSRETFVTFEGMQGGLIPQADPTVLAGMKIVVAPAMYAGGMQPLAHDVTQDLLIAGFAAPSVVGMYDAAALPYRWRGFAFTQGRLV